MVFWEEGKSFIKRREYGKFESIHFFSKRLDFPLPKSFMLDSIEFFELKRKFEVDETFLELKGKILNDEAFNKRIVSNLQQNHLFDSAFIKHIQYALKEDLSASYGVIKESFTKRDLLKHQTDLFRRFIEQTNDFKFCRTCTDDFESPLFWVGIQILMEKGMEENYCLDKSLNYLDKGGEYITNALKVIFELNKKEGVLYVLQSLETSKIVSLQTIDFGNYDAFVDTDLIERLYFKIYRLDFDRFESHHYRRFYSTYLSNLVRDGKVEIEDVLSVLERIKKELILLGDDRYYLNSLMREVRNANFYSEIKSYTFFSALKVVS